MAKVLDPSAVDLADHLGDRVAVPLADPVREPNQNERHIGMNGQARQSASANMQEFKLDTVIDITASSRVKSIAVYVFIPRYI